MTTKDELREEIKTRLLYACPDIDITYALNSMVDFVDTLLAKKREAVKDVLDNYDGQDLGDFQNKILSILS